jgi:hypothetical protein
MNDAFFVGKSVPLRFVLTDKDGEPADPTSYSLTIVRPDGTNESLVATNPAAGDFRNDYFPQTPGRYVATFVGYGDNADAIEDTFDVAPAGSAAVTVTQVKDYAGSNSGIEQWSDAELASTLAAEQSAQARICRIDPYSLDLQEALKRRVVRNLAVRALPIGIAGGANFEPTRLSVRDPEIRRLEGPYRRVTTG